MIQPRLVAMILAVLVVASTAFSPASRPVLTPGRLIQGRATNLASFVLKAEEQQATEGGEEVSTAQVSADGTYYDDEVRDICRCQPFAVFRRRPFFSLRNIRCGVCALCLFCKPLTKQLTCSHDAAGRTGSEIGYF